MTIYADQCLYEIERLTALRLELHKVIPPVFPGNFDLTDDMKARLFEEARALLYSER